MARFGMLKKINYILFRYIYVLFKNQNTAFTTSKQSHKVYRRHNSLIMGGGNMRQKNISQKEKICRKFYYLKYNF